MPAERTATSRHLVLGGALVAVGLLAGLFYAFSVAVMPGFGQADDRTVVAGMQQMNEAIENPVFFLSFLGAPVLTLAALIMERQSGSREAARWILAALVLCGVGLLVTGALNIPLNDELAEAGDPDRIDNLAQVREDFEDPWVAWNAVRTLALTAALGCLTRALMLRGD